jgi:hypothetical protein
MKLKRYSIGIIVSIVVGGLLQFLFAQDAQDVTTFYTNVGQIGLTITNYGVLGTRNSSWPSQPSCEYPIGSRIEHLYEGGLWVGALSRKTGYFHVTTAVTDQPNGTGWITAYEFTPDLNSTMYQRSSLSTSSSFQQNSISHQDFIADYSDTSIVQLSTNSALYHQPLGIGVHQESYAWNFPFTNSFVILSYTIRNISADTLDSVYVGMYGENVVRNTNYVRPTANGYFNYGGNGYEPDSRMMYTFEYQKTPATDARASANSYIGISLLGTTPFPVGIDSLGALVQQTFYNAWTFHGAAGDNAYFAPTDDYLPGSGSLPTSRYWRLSHALDAAHIAPLRTSAANGTGHYSMLSTGPWRTLYPGDSVQVVFAVVCAAKDGKGDESLDTAGQRASLREHLRWAQLCYNGEDLNGNNRLDYGEDIVTRTGGGVIYGADGLLTRYVLPTPPPQPRVHAEVGNQRVTLYWDKAAEDTRDPISGKKDFEGYRVYRSKTGADFLNSSNWLLDLSLLGDFDRSDDTIGYNTGLQKISIDTTNLVAGAKTTYDGAGNFSGILFVNDTVHYFHQFPPRGSETTQLNGWQYLYGISAYDQGDAANGVSSLESAMATLSAITGTKATSNASTEIGVYPNPYYGKAYWDGGGERSRKIYFYNLPANATITIYTIAGDVVAQLDHSSTNAGTNIQWFKQYASSQTPQFAGGEHAWDLISKYDQAIATGLYLFTVKDKDTGTMKRGKFLVIK